MIKKLNLLLSSVINRKGTSNRSAFFFEKKGALTMEKIKLFDKRKVPKHYSGRTQKELKQDYEKIIAKDDFYLSGKTCDGIEQADWRYAFVKYFEYYYREDWYELLTLNEYVQKLTGLDLKSFKNAEMLLTKEEISYLKTMFKPTEKLDWILTFTEIELKKDGDAVVGNAKLKKNWYDYRSMVMLAVFNLYENPSKVVKLVNSDGYKYRSSAKKLFVDKATNMTYLIPEEFANRANTYTLHNLADYSSPNVRKEIFEYIQLRWGALPEIAKEEIERAFRDFYMDVPFTRAIRLAKEEIKCGYRNPITVENFANLIAYGSLNKEKAVKPLIKLPPYWLKNWRMVFLSSVLFFTKVKYADPLSLNIVPVLIVDNFDEGLKFVNTLGLGYVEKFGSIRKLDEGKHTRKKKILQRERAFGTTPFVVPNAEDITKPKDILAFSYLRQSLNDFPARGIAVFEADKFDNFFSGTVEWWKFPTDLRGLSLDEMISEELMLNLYGTLYAELEQQTDSEFRMYVTREQINKDIDYKRKFFREWSKNK